MNHRSEECATESDDTKNEESRSGLTGYAAYKGVLNTRQTFKRIKKTSVRTCLLREKFGSRTHLSDDLVPRRDRERVAVRANHRE